MHRRIVSLAFICAVGSAWPFAAIAGDPLIADRAPSLSLSGNTPSAGTTLTDNLSISSGLSNNLISQPPLLTGRYTLNGQTFMPYIGAGFRGGETTDPNRTVARESVWQEDRLLHDSLGKTLVPNEFQLGVRIPF